MSESFEVLLARHEAKYLVPAKLVPEIREYLRGFCALDRYCQSHPDGYIVTTLQLDTPSLAFHAAKPNRALNRFKLRVRTYGTDGKSPVFLEVKRKIRESVIKSRAAIPPGLWGEDLITAKRVRCDFRSDSESAAFYEFVRLARETGARPVVRIRYKRASFFGVADSYSRVTFDSQLQYQRADDWSVLGGPVWRSMDTSTIQNKQYPYSSVILELKALHEPPLWMLDLVAQFNLLRYGNCKYSTAVWNEAWTEGLIEARSEDLAFV
ncbi:MAG: polyphosphate polymerase domain-containing protein [Spartobacteria bacterium]|nr:polyphosphate polymerase domain-containing protein [Spartobacteria bacterium]